MYSDEIDKLNDNHLININKTKKIIKALIDAKSSYCLTILLDDYSAGTRNDFEIEMLLNIFNEVNLLPDFIMYESKLVDIADKLISQIPDKWKTQSEGQLRFSTYMNDFFLRDDSVQLHNGNRDIDDNDKGDYKFIFMKEKGLFSNNIAVDKSSYDIVSDITLKTEMDGLSKYSCSLLTASWHLFRLGIPNFTNPYSDIFRISEKPFFGDRSLTILPKRYLIVEANALDILSFVNKKSIKKARKKIEYYFH